MSCIELHSAALNCIAMRLSAGHDTPGADLVVGVTSEQGLAIGGPCEGDTLWVTGLASSLDEVWAELVDLALLLEVEDDNLLGGGSAQPVAVWREDEGVDLVTGLEGVEVLGLVQVPQHGGSVLATGGAEGAVWGDGDGVDVAGVADVVGLQAAGGELPDLVIEVNIAGVECVIDRQSCVRSEISAPVRQSVSHGP